MTSAISIARSRRRRTRLAISCRSCIQGRRRRPAPPARPFVAATSSSSVSYRAMKFSNENSASDSRAAACTAGCGLETSSISLAIVPGMWRSRSCRVAAACTSPSASASAASTRSLDRCPAIGSSASHAANASRLRSARQQRRRKVELGVVRGAGQRHQPHRRGLLAVGGSRWHTASVDARQANDRMRSRFFARRRVAASSGSPKQRRDERSRRCGARRSLRTAAGASCPIRYAVSRFEHVRVVAARSSMSTSVSGSRVVRRIEDRPQRRARRARQHDERLDQLAAPVHGESLDGSLEALQHAAANRFRMPAVAARVLVARGMDQSLDELDDQPRRRLAPRPVGLLGDRDQRGRQVELARLAGHVAGVGEQLVVRRQQPVAQRAAHASLVFIDGPPERLRAACASDAGPPDGRACSCVARARGPRRRTRIRRRDSNAANSAAVAASLRLLASDVAGRSSQSGMCMPIARQSWSAVARYGPAAIAEFPYENLGRKRASPRREQDFRMATWRAQYA